MYGFNPLLFSALLLSLNEYQNAPCFVVIVIMMMIIIIIIIIIIDIFV